MKHIIYNVICPYKEHRPLPYSVDVHEAEKIVSSNVEIYCPYCDKFVTVKIKGKPVDNTEIQRRYGFIKE